MGRRIRGEKRKRGKRLWEEEEEERAPLWFESVQKRRIGGKKSLAPSHRSLRCAPLRSASLTGSFASEKVATYEREPLATILDRFEP